VDETFDADVAGCHDAADFVQMELPCQHHALKPQVGKLPDPGGVVDGHLGGGVQRDSREKTAGQSCYGQVLDYDRIHLHRFEGREGVNQGRQFVLLDQGVEGHIDLFLQAVGIGEHPFHLLQGEVFCLGSGGKLLQACIDGISPFFHGGKKRFQRTGGGQKFGFFLKQSVFGHVSQRSGNAFHASSSMNNILIISVETCCILRLLLIFAKIS